MEWFVLRSQPHKEELLYRQVRAREVECFYPRVKVIPVDPRSATRRPLFPNYMFVHCRLSDLGDSFFTWMPYAQGLVRLGDEPATVPSSIINALKRRVNDLNQSCGLNFRDLKQGTEVRVIEGPFRGYEGIFDERLDGHTRVRILLSFVNDRQVPVDLEVNQIKPKK